MDEKMLTYYANRKVEGASARQIASELEKAGWVLPWYAKLMIFTKKRLQWFFGILATIFGVPILLLITGTITDSFLGFLGLFWLILLFFPFIFLPGATSTHATTDAWMPEPTVIGIAIAILFYLLLTFFLSYLLSRRGRIST